MSALLIFVCELTEYFSQIIGTVGPMFEHTFLFINILSLASIMNSALLTMLLLKRALYVSKYIVVGYIKLYRKVSHSI